MAAAFVGWFTTVYSVFSQTWTPVMTPLRFMPWNQWVSVASSANGSNLVVAAANGPILISTDSGSDWIPASVPPLNWSSVAESTNGAVIAAAALNGAIYTSTDSGAAWIQTSAPSNNWTAIALSANGNKMVVAATNGPIYLSTDTGATWTAANVSTNGLSAPIMWSAVASSADGNDLFAVTSPGYYYVLSTNSGSSWVGFPEDVGPVKSIACSADGTRLAIAYERWVLTWTNDLPIDLNLSDTNWNWALVETNPIPVGSYTNYLTAVASSADGSKLVAAEASGRIFTSSDLGATWNPANAPVLSWSSVAASADGGKMVAVSRDGGIFLYGTIPQPQLGLATSGGSNVLWWSWPATGFVLQRNSNLSTTNWTDVTNMPTLVNQLILPSSGSNVFYRLKSP